MADPYVGQISMFGFPYAPQNWAICAGQVLAISQNQALFSLLGYLYGGSTNVNFKLPDLQGRLPMGQGNGQYLTPRSMGQQFGVEQTLLQPTQCAAPAHTHTLAASDTASDALTQNPAAGWTLGAAASVVSGRTPTITPVQMYGPANPANPVQSAPTSIGGGTSATTPLSLVNPALVLNFSIALTGLYPPRN